MPPRCARARVRAIAILTASLIPSAASAQAWLPQRHEGSVSVLFQHLFVTDHLLGDGTAVDVGHITTDNMLVDATYGRTSKQAGSQGRARRRRRPHHHRQYAGGCHVRRDIEDGREPGRALYGLRLSGLETASVR